MKPAYTVGRGSDRVGKPRTNFRVINTQTNHFIEFTVPKRQALEKDRQTDKGLAPEPLSGMEQYYSLVPFPWTTNSAALSLRTARLPGYSRVTSPMTLRVPTLFPITERTQKCLLPLCGSGHTAPVCKEASVEGVSPLQITCWPHSGIHSHTSRTQEAEPRGLQASGQPVYIMKPCFQTMNEWHSQICVTVYLVIYCVSSQCCTGLSVNTICHTPTTPGDTVVVLAFRELAI